MMHSNLSYLRKLKPHKKSKLSELRELKFEFIEYTIGFMCLKLMFTTTRTARESNPLSYPHRETEPQCPNHSSTEALS